MYINGDIKLRIGGRNAVKITAEELAQKMETAAIKAGETRLETAPNPSSRMQCIISTLHESVLTNDNKLEVSCENIDIYEQEDNLLGFHTLSNGFTFFGYTAGGDWGVPVFMIVYWDGKKLRGYTPTGGNLINTDWNCALGDESVWGDEERAQKVREKYKKAGMSVNDDLWAFMESAGELYCSKYNTCMDDVKHNWTVIRQDIEARIVLDAPVVHRKKPETPTQPRAKTPLEEKYKSVKKLVDQWLKIRVAEKHSIVSILFTLQDGQTSILYANPRNFVFILGYVPENLRKRVKPDGEVNGILREYVNCFQPIAIDAEIILQDAIRDHIIANIAVYADTCEHPIQATLMNWLKQCHTNPGKAVKLHCHMHTPGNDTYVVYQDGKFYTEGCYAHHLDNICRNGGPAKLLEACLVIFDCFDVVIEDANIQMSDCGVADNSIEMDAQFAITPELTGMLELFDDFKKQCHANPDRKVTLSLMLSNGEYSYLTCHADGRHTITGCVPDALQHILTKDGQLTSLEPTVIMAAYTEDVIDCEIIVE